MNQRLAMECAFRTTSGWVGIGMSHETCEGKWRYYPACEWERKTCNGDLNDVF